MTVHQHTTSTTPAPGVPIDRPTTDTSRTTEIRKAGAVRRAVLVAAGVVGCVVPTVWSLNFVRMLATGELAEHRFHQLTGQGLLLTAVWLGSLVPMLVAAWRGRRPSTAAGLLHLSFLGVGVACSIAAPQGGARELMGLIAVTGAVVWLALPHRARLRVPVDVAPAGLAVALLAGAVVAPYAVDQIALQHEATGMHADNPHYFDMAWLTLTLALAGVLGGLLPAARRLQAVAGAGLFLTGVAMLALSEGALDGVLLTGVGALQLAAWQVGDRVRRTAIGHAERTR